MAIISKHGHIDFLKQLIHNGTCSHCMKQQIILRHMILNLITLNWLKKNRIFRWQEQLDKLYHDINDNKLDTNGT